MKLSKLTPHKFWCLPLLFAFVGCAPRQNEDLLGTYLAELPSGEETLHLLPGGVCEQQIRLSSGMNFSAHGHWKFDPSRSRLSLVGTRVSLNGFGRMNPSIAEIPSGGTGSLPVGRRIFGGIEIGTRDGILYRKTGHPKEPNR